MDNITFDNLDNRIKYYHLELERDLPEHFDEPKLPEGYRFVYYQPGDRDEWIRIEWSAKEFDSFEAGVSAWNRYYRDHEAELPERMFFIEDEKGEKVATASAMYDTFGTDDGVLGWLHWVSVRRDHQGMGLSRPLVAHTLNRLIELGYKRAHIPTQCTTWVACRLYLSFGFMPTDKNAVEAREGWNIVKTLTDHPSLKDFDILPIEDILA